MMQTFHGFRLGDICEASTLDIEEEDGIPIIWIRLKNRPKTMRIKTGFSKRRVAIHSACLSAGFGLCGTCQGAPRRWAGGAAAFITEGEAAVPAPAGVAWAAQHHASKLVMDFLRSLGIAVAKKDGGRGHSWRHTVATLIEDAGVPDARSRYICGHAPRDKHARYLHHAAAKLREAIECVPSIERASASYRDGVHCLVAGLLIFTEVSITDVTP
jgi:integrase